MDGFAPGSSEPHVISVFTQPRDIDWLAEASATKLVKLSQRVWDLHAQIPEGQTIIELSNDKVRHERRIHDLTKSRTEGGYNLDASAPQVRDEQRKLDKVVAERARLQELTAARSPRWTAAGQLERAVLEWLRDGIPADCVLDVVEDTPPEKLLANNECISAGVARYRRKLADLASKLAKVRTAPYPSKLAIQKATDQIEALATAPDCAGIIDRLQPISFATQAVTSMVRNVDAAPAAVTFVETTNTLGLIAWMFRRELLAKITDEIKQVARDGEALDEPQRQTQEAALRDQMMDCERAECSLIWGAESQGSIIDFRLNTTAAALLGLTLITGRRR